MIGVLDFIGKFKKPFETKKEAAKYAKSNGLTTEGVLKLWEDKKNNGISIHKKLQEEESKEDNVESFNRDSYGDAKEITEKDTPLENNKTYLERRIYSLKHGLIGYPDKIIVKNNTISIQDTKTWKKIRYKSKSIKIGSEFKKAKFFDPIDSLDDCNYIEAVLQLSLYMRILWETNKYLKIGNLYIRHISTNEKNEIVKEELIEVPYLRDEVEALLKYKKDYKL